MNDWLSQFHVEIFDPARIPYAFVAIFITIFTGLISGPLAGNANPFIWQILGTIFGRTGDRLDRAHRPRPDLVFRGFMVTVFVIFFALLTGKFFEYLVARLGTYGVMESLLLALLLTGGSVWYALLRLYSALEKNEVGQGAYYAISHSTRRNLTVGDDFGITRAAMGFAARAFDKGLVAPVFWYMAGGLPLALLYSCMAGLAWRFGKDGFGSGLGVLPLALERVMGFIPGLLAAVLLTLASIFTPTAGIARSIAAWAGMKNRAPYEQGGLPLSVMAWALHVSLGGAGQDLAGSAIKGAWVGPEGATAQLNHKHLRRALYMSVIAHFLFLASIGGAYVWGNV